MASVSARPERPRRSFRPLLRNALKLRLHEGVEALAV
jgi:hypothetical protein